MYIIYITFVFMKVIWMYHFILWANKGTSNSGMTGLLILRSGGTINGNSGKISLNTDSIVSDMGGSMNLLTGFDNMDLDDW